MTPGRSGPAKQVRNRKTMLTKQTRRPLVYKNYLHTWTENVYILLSSTERIRMTCPWQAEYAASCRRSWCCRTAWGLTCCRCVLQRRRPSSCTLSATASSGHDGIVPSVDRGPASTWSRAGPVVWWRLPASASGAPVVVGIHRPCTASTCWAHTTSTRLHWVGRVEAYATPRVDRVPVVDARVAAVVVECRQIWRAVPLWASAAPAWICPALCRTYQQTAMS